MQEQSLFRDGHGISVMAMYLNSTLTLSNVLLYRSAFQVVYLNENSEVLSVPYLAASIITDAVQK